MSLRAHVRLRRGTLDLDVPLTADAGETLGLLGRNGSGKTTLLHALAGLLRLQGGDITLAGRTLAGPGTHVPAPQRHVGLLAADHLLFPHLSALDNVAFGPRSRGASRAAARERARTELAALDVDDLADRRPAALSHGQAQRVALARALASDPALLLLDEPLAALDPTTRPHVRATLAHRLAAYDGVTVLVTHDPLDALTLARRLVFVDAGRVVQEGTPAEVVTHPRDRYVAEVVGLNLYAGEAGADGVVTTAGGPVVTGGEVGPGPAWVVFAPSAVTVHAERPHGSARNVWPVTVAGVEMLGQSARVRLTGSLRLTAEVTTVSVTELGLLPGTRAWASVKATEVRAYPR